MGADCLCRSLGLQANVFGESAAGFCQAIYYGKVLRLTDEIEGAEGFPDFVGTGVDEDDGLV